MTDQHQQLVTLSDSTLYSTVHAVYSTVHCCLLLLDVIMSLTLTKAAALCFCCINQNLFVCHVHYAAVICGTLLVAN